MIVIEHFLWSTQGISRYEYSLNKKKDLLKRQVIIRGILLIFRNYNSKWFLSGQNIYLLKCNCALRWKSLFLQFNFFFLFLENVFFTEIEFPCFLTSDFLYIMSNAVFIVLTWIHIHSLSDSNVFWTSIWKSQRISMLVVLNQLSICNKN